MIERTTKKKEKKFHEKSRSEVAVSEYYCPACQFIRKIKQMGKNVKDNKNLMEWLR